MNLNGEIIRPPVSVVSWYDISSNINNNWWMKILSETETKLFHLKLHPLMLHCKVDKKAITRNRYSRIPHPALNTNTEQRINCCNSFYLLTRKISTCIKPKHSQPPLIHWRGGGEGGEPPGFQKAKNTKKYKQTYPKKYLKCKKKCQKVSPKVSPKYPARKVYLSWYRLETKQYLLHYRLA